MSGNITTADFSKGIPEQNNTFLVGTFPSKNLTHTANSTIHAAHALWHFAQTWFEEFPPYKPNDEKISIWTESYGGKYGPGFTTFFTQQNEKIANGTISGPGTHYLHMDTLGIINGCIENLYQEKTYFEMPYNNTYGIQAYNQSVYEHSLHEWEKPGGIEDQIRECQKAAEELDPDERGNIDKINHLCQLAGISSESLVGPYFQSKKVSILS